MKLYMLLASCCVWWCWPLDAGADEVDDVKHFDEVRAKIEKVLPKGWHVKAAIADESVKYPEGFQRYPRLVIRSDEPLMARYVGISSPFRSGDDDGHEPKVMEVTIFTVRYVTPQQFLEMHRINEESQRLRERFGKRVRSIIDVRDKDWTPPHFVHAETDEQLQARREYAFLYLRTERISLPTHHYQSLSFDVLEDHYELQDKGKNAEYGQLLGHLDRILTRYRVPKAAE